MNKKWIPTIILWAIGLVFFLPLYWLFASSLKSDLEITQFPPTFWPHTLEWSNYPKIWEALKFSTTFTNSIIVSVSCTALVVVFSSMAGYAFSKKQFMGKNALFILLIATMTVPPTVLLLPIYFIITKIGLYDSLASLILPFGVTVFGIFFTKQYIDDVPTEMLEAARIDGSGEFRLFFQIVLPLIKPAITTLTIIEFVHNWNSFTMPLVLLQSEDKFTIPLRLALLAQENIAIPWSRILAANVLSLIPVLILFLSVQKQFVKGLMAGAVKG
ncbi:MULTISPECIES: carbohydrate ABC transporter permease [Paenibacillus]|uniref:Sugar ABC transporter ATP-binding protein n=1 Tax=Paenibacillus naphthalenovorans TaxID=162209 RepID=A0A0U2VUC1_9BACL|nr:MULTISPECIES: carbohydrate ABC transporter permease [Paenibacillus]ALS24294.1 sugar ABC transporter ATP-binding protein [Paenibacillus naphthalenovorans]SDI52709.1 multiple sugar transport system permease protein/alpha-1,4-digalacturonate transport system permease protein [Paenibacillus naphthalenovorans]